LPPDGFDPSRFAILGRAIADKRAVSISYCWRAEDIDAMIKSVEPYRTPSEYTIIQRERVLVGPDWFQRTIDLAADQPWVSLASLHAMAQSERSGA
jgi:hypothetical protein